MEEILRYCGYVIPATIDPESSDFMFVSREKRDSILKRKLAYEYFSTLRRGTILAAPKVYYDDANSFTTTNGIRLKLKDGFCIFIVHDSMTG